mmetsp:Transcript_42528/g.106320  ORF Transcript_42528/g.106320 Transcript_42528/m.106320 type:complete len:327 (+) Transcript_42528:22-1002(+)
MAEGGGGGGGPDTADKDDAGGDWDMPSSTGDLSMLSANTAEWTTGHKATLGGGTSLGQNTDLDEVIVDESKIIHVWKDNLEDAFKEISQIVTTHTYVAMDTEFPGVVARPYGTFRSHTDYLYQTLKCNVDLLRMIQCGLTFSDENGNLHARCTWQFHFHFDLAQDIWASDSIELLQKAGVDFERHSKEGIDAEEFGSLLIVSGLTLCPEVRWVSFHSYLDFGYLVKILSCQALPEKESTFFALLNDYFPCFFDIKYIMQSCESLKGGLNRIAEVLDVKRVGPTHQAGSDSLVTSLAFFKMGRLFFENNIDETKYAGVLYGLGQYGT